MRIVVAGTFGPIHDGHRRLLETALERADDGLIVGLTSDEFATGKREREVPSFDQRRRALDDELAGLDEWDRSWTITAIEDPFGPAATDSSLDAIVVSTETESEVERVNEARAERDLAPLEPIVVPLVSAEDGDRISSTRIAHDEIDEHGRAADV
jgi:pantetheine-phosphate adenylyltransferase